MKRIRLAIVLVALVTSGTLLAGCGTPTSSTTSSSATDSTTQPPAVSSTAASTLPDAGEIAPAPAATQPVPAIDGWTITLIPGTDQMRGVLEESGDAGQPGVTISRPAPATFEASVAIDGDRVVYSAFYEEAPQVYLYDIPSGEVTKLTYEAPVKYLEQMPVQISGDWVAWMKGYSRNDIHLINVATGEAKEFTPHDTVVSWRLVSGRLAWMEMEQLHQSQLSLYDPAVGSVQTIDAAYGLLSFDMDDRHIAWAGGQGWNEYYLYDLATGTTERVATDSQQNGEFVVVKGDILAWTGRTGERTTLVVHRLDTGEQKVVDEFGPFNPELQADSRHIVWNRGEDDTGTAVWAYDTETGGTIDLGGTWPSIDAGRVAWLQFFPGRGREVVMVRDLAGGPATQLTNSRWGDQPPVISGDHVVWARRNSDSSSSKGRGIFVATAPAEPPAPAFADLSPDVQHRSAVQWLGERGYDTGYPGPDGPEFRPQEELAAADFRALVGRVLTAEVSDTDPDLSGEGPLSRAQMVAVLVRAFDSAYPGKLPPAPKDWPSAGFDDPEYGEYLTRASWNYLLEGLALHTETGWEWDYSAPATRAEAAQLLWNAAGAYLEP